MVFENLQRFHVHLPTKVYAYVYERSRDIRARGRTLRNKAKALRHRHHFVHIQVNNITSNRQPTTPDRRKQRQQLRVENLLTRDNDPSQVVKVNKGTWRQHNSKHGNNSLGIRLCPRAACTILMLPLLSLMLRKGPTMAPHTASTLNNRRLKRRLLCLMHRTAVRTARHRNSNNSNSNMLLLDVVNNNNTCNKRHKTITPMHTQIQRQDMRACHKDTLLLVQLSMVHLKLASKLQSLPTISSKATRLGLLMLLISKLQSNKLSKVNSVELHITRVSKHNKANTQRLLVNLLLHSELVLRHRNFWKC